MTCAKRECLLLLLSALCLPSPARAEELTLAEAMKAAVLTSPSLLAARSRITAAQHEVGMARSGLLPQVELDGIDSTGLPGSSNWLGIHGAMGSPFRQGLAAGVAGKQMVWDFGRTLYGIETARKSEDLAASDGQIAELEVRRLTLEAFYACSVERSEEEAFREILDDAKTVEKQTDYFVRTGQSSIVERSLAASQTEQVQTELAGHAAALLAAKERLTVLTGIPAARFDCPLLPPAATHGPPSGANAVSTDVSLSPLVVRADRAAAVARSEVHQATSENFPFITAVASAGYLEDSRLVQKQDYSLGIGATFPVFEGFRIQENVRRSESIAMAREADLEFAKQSVQELISRLDQTIQSESTRIVHLDREWTLATNAYAVAKRRYFTFRGQVVDLREALRNLSGVVERFDEARFELEVATGERSLILGSR